MMTREAVYTIEKVQCRPGQGADESDADFSVRLHALAALPDAQVLDKLEPELILLMSRAEHNGHNWWTIGEGRLIRDYDHERDLPILIVWAYAIPRESGINYRQLDTWAETGKTRVHIPLPPTERPW